MKTKKSATVQEKVHPLVYARKQKRRRLFASILKGIVGSVGIVAMAVFAAMGADSYFGWHRITSVENRKGQCYMYEKTEMALGGLPLVGRALMVDTDNKRFRFGYGVTLDVGTKGYFTEDQLTKAYGAQRIDCEIYYNNYLRFQQENETQNAEEKTEEKK